MFDNLMHKFRYGNVSSPDVYLDENTLRMCGTHRMMFAQLVDALLREGKREQAKEALDYCMEVLPGTTVRHNYYSSILANAYYILNEGDKADDIIRSIADDCVQYIDWANSLKPNKKKTLQSQMGQKWALLNHVLSISDRYKRTELLNEYEAAFQQYAVMFN